MAGPEIRNSMEYVEDPSTEESSLEKVEKCEQLYKDADQVRKAYEPDIYLNCAFLAGRQYEEASEDFRRWGGVDLPVLDARQRLVSNRILSLTRSVASTMIQSAAAQTGVPATTDQDDVMAALLSTDLIQSRHHEDDEENLQREEVMWKLVGGRVARRVYYDPDADGWGLTGKVESMGDIRTYMRHPFQFHTSPYVDCFGQFPWLIESDVRSIEEINDTFPGKDVEEEECQVFTQMLDRLLVNILSGSEYNSTPKRQKVALLKQLYLRPDKKHPQGRWIIWANGKLLRETDLPDGVMPWVLKDWFPIPGRVYPLPYISPLRDLQREINYTITQLCILKDRQLRGDIMMRGYGTPTYETDPETGRLTITLPPTILSHELMKYDLNPGEAEQTIARLWNDMKEVGGQHESSLGESPGHRVTATQLLSLKESDMSALTWFRAGADHAQSKVEQLKIIAARHHFLVPHLLRVVGAGNRLRVGAFFGAQLRNTQDVRPRPTPMVTEVMKLQLRQTATEQGLFGPYANTEDMLCKLLALLTTSGIPDIEEEVESRIAPMTIEELQATVAGMYGMRARIELAQLGMQAVQAEAQVAQMQAAIKGQQPQVDQFGNTAPAGGPQPSPQPAMAQ